MPLRFGARAIGRLVDMRPVRGRREPRHAIRALRRSPWYAATVVGVIALGIAPASTAFAARPSDRHQPWVWQRQFGGDPDIVGRVLTPHAFRTLA
jgi:hypothetical protein